MDSQPDWLAIVFAALLNFGIGYVWYSKWLFKDMWQKLAQKKEKDLRRGYLPIVWSFCISLVIAFFLDFFERHLAITTVSDGMLLAFFLWLGFTVTTQISSVIWMKKPWKLFAIHAGCRLLGYLVMGGVLGS